MNVLQKAGHASLYMIGVNFQFNFFNPASFCIYMQFGLVAGTDL